MGKLLLLFILPITGEAWGDNVLGIAIYPEEVGVGLDNSSWTALPPPGAVDDTEPLNAHVRMAQADGDLGPPISPEEFAAAMANSSQTVPPPPGAVDAIEHSEEFEGDIKLTADQQAQMRMGGRSAILSDAWYKGIIPYTISSVFTSGERQVIARAMAEYENRTCIRFTNRTTEPDYINIISSSGCWSYVGRIGGRQYLSLRQSGCVHFGIVIHEFMHAAGFWHEQSRYDRDKYVIINLENVLSGRENNFEKKPKNESTDLATKYDCGSVMHYSAYAFSKNGKPTITSKKCNGTLGQRNGFSESDVVGLNRRYNCRGQKCRNGKRCKRQGGKCQKTWTPCSGTIVKRGCMKRMGCVCCITA